MEIAQLDQQLVEEAWEDEKVRLVMSIPGNRLHGGANLPGGDWRRLPVRQRKKTGLLSTRFAPVPCPPPTPHETGHFYFAQTGHSHFAPTDECRSLTTPRAKGTMRVK